MVWSKAQRGNPNSVAVAESRRPLSITRFAPAKLNLYLHVTGRRPDGYHELDSLVVFLDVGDRLDVEAASLLRLDVRGPNAEALAAEDDNLVLRAARALAGRMAGGVRGADILLTKELPIAAGLGGGSSDAAATLRALAQLWGCDITEDALAALALRLGADVPACLQAKPLRLLGVGERLEEVPALPDFHVLLVNPGLPLATSSVFAARRGSFSGPVSLPAVFEGFDHLLSVLAATGNDLEAPACAMQGEIAAALAALRRLPEARLVRMSGSGATCFALFAERVGAEDAATRLRIEHPNWWTRAAGLLQS